MKPFVRNTMFTIALALTAGSMAVAQTSTSWSEQWYRAKYGRPAPTKEARIPAEQAKTAYGEVAPAQATLPANAWFENWYPDKFGRQSPLETGLSPIGAKNLVSPTYRRPTVQTVVRKGLTDKRAKQLTTTAESLMDHLALAEFYIAKAERLEAQASGYEEAAATYRNGPTIKNLMSPTTAGRYEFFATKLRDEARFSRALAASHERTALIASH